MKGINSARLLLGDHMSLIKCYSDLPGCESALGLEGGPVWEKKGMFWKKNVPLSFASERFHVAAPATAVTVCIFDIWSDTKKKGTGVAYQCHYFILLGRHKEKER